jgi:hypothetical protein
MNRLSRKVLEQYAAAARSALESGSVSREVLSRLYTGYNPDVAIDSFLDKAAELFPSLNCGLASVYLQHVLDQGSVVRGRYGSQLHTFLVIDDTVVDITADQYGGPRVYVGPLRAPWAVRK